MTAEQLMLCGGTTAFLLTLYWVRTRDLREKYAAMWVVVAAAVFVVGAFPRLIMSFAEANHLSYSSAVLFLALPVVYLFALSASVSLSHSRRDCVRLSQDVALLRHELERLQAREGDVPQHSSEIRKGMDR